MASFSVIVACRPATLSKSFRLENGALVSTAAAQMLEGEALLRRVDNLSQLLQLFERAKGHAWAICAGVTGYDRVAVVTKKRIKPGAVARSRQYFHFPSGAGLLALDYDPDGTPLTAEQLHSALIDCCPWLYGVEMLFTPSASGCIYRGETMLKGPGGWHCYMIIDDAADIPRAVDAIFQATFPRHGHAFVTKSGAIIPKTIIDRSSPQPERLLFEAGAILESAELSQRRPPPLLIKGQRVAGVPAAHNYDMWRTTDPVWRSMKDDARDEAERAREIWIAERLASGKVKESDLRHMLKYRTLADDFDLLGVGRVGDVRGRFIGMQICDPLEPDYRDGALCAVILRWGVYSMAHGGYALHFDEILPDESLIYDA